MKRKTNKKILAGFSFIELLVVIAIVSVTAGMVLLPYSEDRIKREMEANARELVGTIREAQSYALTGKQLIPGTTPCGVEIRWGSTSYSLVYKYKTSGSYVCDRDTVISTKVLKRGATFAGGTSSFYFSLPHGIPMVGSSVLPTVMPILLLNGISTHAVCVYAQGRVLDQTGSSCPS